MEGAGTGRGEGGGGVDVLDGVEGKWKGEWFLKPYRHLLFPTSSTDVRYYQICPIAHIKHPGKHNQTSDAYGVP